MSDGIDTDGRFCDYSPARKRFLDAAQHARWTVESHVFSGAGPNGESLVCDAAFSPGRTDDKLLIVSSGLHGVEGRFGSAVQIAALERRVSSPRSGVRWLFLHALNPFGFAWSRRFDAENIDPNRNFLLDGEPYAGAPETYAALDSLLNPRRPPSRADLFRVKAAGAILRYGMPALRQAVAGGQYEFPLGLFFGGRGSSETFRFLRRGLSTWAGEATRIVHLDFHTGLGPWRTWKLLGDHPLTESQRDRMRRTFGAGAISEFQTSDTSYHARGGFGGWCAEELAGRDYVYFCAEFGTYGPVTMLAALRAENQAHHWGHLTDRATRRAKTRLREVFCPASASWRTWALQEGLTLVDRASSTLTTPITRTER